MTTNLHITGDKAADTLLSESPLLKEKYPRNLNDYGG